MPCSAALKQTLPLLSLEPRWLTPDVLAFRCPVCREVWLTCKRIELHYRDQFDLFEKHFGDDWNQKVVPCSPKVCWTFIDLDFKTLTIKPSLDASPAGHWHGHVKRGWVV